MEGSRDRDVVNDFSDRPAVGRGYPTRRNSAARIPPASDAAANTVPTIQRSKRVSTVAICVARRLPRFATIGAHAGNLRGEALVEVCDVAAPPAIFHGEALVETGELGTELRHAGLELVRGDGIAPLNRLVDGPGDHLELYEPAFRSPREPHRAADDRER